MTESTFLPKLSDDDAELAIHDQKPIRELSIFDKDNPFSMINKIPDPWNKYFMAADEELLQKDESEVRQVVKPTPLVNKLRLAFWVEYDMACKLGRKMDLRRVYGGLCAREKFIQGICKKTKKMSWLLCPVSTYRTSLEEALETSIAQMRKILDTPLYKDHNCKELDYRAADIILKIYDRLDQRIHGGVVQKIEQKQLTLTKKIDTPVASPDEIKEKLELLESEIRRNENNRPIIDVEVIDEVKKEST